MKGSASWKGKEREVGWVGGPMNADDSLGGKAGDAQIIRGRLEGKALGHIGPEIPVPQAAGTFNGE